MFDAVTTPKVEIPLTLKFCNKPTEVNDEFVTVGPRVVLFNTESVPVLNSPPSVTPIPIEDSKVLEVLLNVNVLRILTEPIPIPAPSRSELVPTVVAIPTLKSASSMVDELTINCVPSIYKSPLILNEPVLSPTPAGSIVISDGPEIVFDVTLIAEPSEPVWNDVAVITPVDIALLNLASLFTFSKTFEYKDVVDKETVFCPALKKYKVSSSAPGDVSGII